LWPWLCLGAVGAVVVDGFCNKKAALGLSAASSNFGAFMQPSSLPRGTRRAATTENGAAEVHGQLYARDWAVRQYAVLKCRLPIILNAKPENTRKA
jgi:hypothetical protein